MGAQGSAARAPPRLHGREDGLLRNTELSSRSVLIEFALSDRWPRRAKRGVHQDVLTHILSRGGERPSQNPETVQVIWPTLAQPFIVLGTTESTAASGSASASASTPASAPPPSATQRERSAAACTTLRPRMRQSDVNMSSPLSALPRASAAGRARAPGRRRQRSRCPPSPPGRGEHDGRRASRPRQRARARRRAPPPPPLDTAMDSASAAGFKTSVASSSLENLLRRPRRANQACVRNGGRRALAQTTA